MKSINFCGHKLKAKSPNIFGTQDYEYISNNLSIFVDQNKYDYSAIYNFQVTEADWLEITVEAQTLKGALSKLNRKVESLKKKINRL
jgi:hypothetical protein